MIEYKKPPSPVIDWALDLLDGDAEVRRPMNVLNLGCGTGRNLHHLAKMGHSVWGLDISAALIEAAHKRFEQDKTSGRYAFDCLDQVKELPYQNGQFDLAISIFAFNEIADRTLRLKCLKEVVRVLKKPGHLLLQVPDSGSHDAVKVTERYRGDVKTFIAFSLLDLLKECSPPLRLTNYILKNNNSGGEIEMDHVSLWRAE